MWILNDFERKWTHLDNQSASIIALLQHTCATKITLVEWKAVLPAYDKVLRCGVVHALSYCYRKHTVVWFVVLHKKLGPDLSIPIALVHRLGHKWWTLPAVVQYRDR